MSSAAVKAFEDLSPSERSAILTLLEDEGAEVHRLLVDRLVGYGPSVLDWLVPLLPGASPVMRQRIQGVQEVLEREQRSAEFLLYCARPEGEMELEDGVWRFVLTEYPLVNLDGYQALVDSFAEVLRDRLSPDQDGESLMAVFNRYVFDELGFVGNEADYHDPENSFLNRVIDRRTGIPITLSVLVLLIGKRLGLPLSGVGMPGHFLSRFRTARHEFYVDAFNRGKLLTKQDCIRFLNQTKFGFRSEYLEPVTPRSILLRMCQNLLQHGRHGLSSVSLQRYESFAKALSRKR